MTKKGIKKEIEDWILWAGFTWEFEEIYDHYCEYREGCYVSNTCKQTILKFEKELEWLFLTMEFVLTSNIQKGRKCSDGKSRTLITYYVNGVEILTQKVPYDEEYDFGFCHRIGIYDVYVLGNNIYQKRQKIGCTLPDEEIPVRDVKFPLSKKVLEDIGLPPDFKLVFWDECDDIEYPVARIEELKQDLITDLLKIRESRKERPSIWECETLDGVYKHTKIWSSELALSTTDREGFGKRKNDIIIDIHTEGTRFKFNLSLSDLHTKDSKQN